MTSTSGKGALWPQSPEIETLQNFLNFLDDWKRLSGKDTNDSNDTITNSTYTGLIVTLKATFSIAEELRKEGNTLLMTSRLSQDCLEELGMIQNKKDTVNILNVYDEECATMKVKPDELALAVLRYAQSTGELDASNVQFTEATLRAFASILVKTNLIKCVNFTDGLLSTEALTTILNALKSNNSVTKLILYGNNIKKDGTIALGQLLSLNKTISTLNLKWNNLGLEPDVFAVFCSALCSSDGLSHIDLRSNRIDCEGASNLAAALRRNKSIKTLDLRVNNIRNPGAQSIFDALEDNRTVETILLKSNPISHPVMIAINERLKNNNAVVKLNKMNTAKNSELLEIVKNMEINHSQEMNKIVESSNTQLMEIRKEADNLAKNLDERLNEIRRLTENVKVLEGRLEQEKKQTKELNFALREKDEAFKSVVMSSSVKIDELLQKVKQREAELVKMEAAREKEVREILGLKDELEKDLTNARNTNTTLKNRIREIQNSKDNDIMNQIKSLEVQRDLWAKKCRELETSAEERVLKIREESLEKQQALENTIMEVSEKQSTRLVIFTERCERFKQEKQTLEEQISSLQKTIIRLQQENSELISQASEPNRKITALLEEISSERILNQKLRQEKQGESNACEELRRELRQLEKEMDNARKDRQRMEKKFEEDLRESQNTFKDLQKRLEEKKKKMDAMRRQDKERARMLHDAFSRFYAHYSAVPSGSGDSST